MASSQNPVFFASLLRTGPCCQLCVPWSKSHWILPRIHLCLGLQPLQGTHLRALPPTEIINGSTVYGAFGTHPTRHKCSGFSLQNNDSNAFNESQALCWGLRRHGNDFCASETGYLVGVGQWEAAKGRVIRQAYVSLCYPLPEEFRISALREGCLMRIPRRKRSYSKEGALKRRHQVVAFEVSSEEGLDGEGAPGGGLAGPQVWRWSGTSAFRKELLG